jgi:5-methylthioadenosine/S-adenosylhomocysteine deaminase
MATQGGADALGLGDLIGSLEVGKRADVIVVDLHTAHMWPILHGQDSNVVEQLVYSASANDVLTTIVDGQVLMQDRQVRTMDPAGIELAVREAAEDLIRKAGVRAIRRPS